MTRPILPGDTDRPEWLEYDASEMRVRFVEDFSKVVRELRRAYRHHTFEPVMRKLMRGEPLTEREHRMFKD